MKKENFPFYESNENLKPQALLRLYDTHRRNNLEAIVSGFIYDFNFSKRQTRSKLCSRRTDAGEKRE